MIDLTFNMINGDCELIADEENMVQACVRRLDTILDTTLYEEYGSNLRDLCGLRKTEVNLQFLNQIINDCLTQDERITECAVNCEYKIDSILAAISIKDYEDNILEFDYEFGGDE